MNTENSPIVVATECAMIVSGGQTGADRGALDAAIELGIEHGGWCPKGHKAEDGQIPRRYQLRDSASASYPERTRRNVRDADATLVLTMGPPGRGSALTIRTARQCGRPVLHLDLAEVDAGEACEQVRAWLDEHDPTVLNVAGGRESKSPGLGSRVRRIMLSVLGGSGGSHAGSCTPSSATSTACSIEPEPSASRCASMSSHVQTALGAA